MGQTVGPVVETCADREDCLVSLKISGGRRGPLEIRAADHPHQIPERNTWASITKPRERREPKDSDPNTRILSERCRNR